MEGDREVHSVRLYVEYLESPDALRFEELKTYCLTDDLLYADAKLALTERMSVSIAPSPRKWFASVPLASEMERATPVWVNEREFVYVQRPTGPVNNVTAINRLLNWYCADSTATDENLSHWETDEIFLVA